MLGMPMLPTSQTVRDGHSNCCIMERKMEVIIEQVVPFPLVPVTPIILALQCSKKYWVMEVQLLSSGLTDGLRKTWSKSDN